MFVIRTLASSRRRFSNHVRRGVRHPASKGRQTGRLVGQCGSASMVVFIVAYSAAVCSR